MATGARRRISPQVRGRELARQGTGLWQQTESVPAAAEELMRQHRDLPRLQAFRYACGLSQDQAAARYNEVAGHRTTLGGTTINAWETWARGQGAGSPPPLSALLILAAAYSRGPLGVAADAVTAADLVDGIDERLAPEDRVALRALSQGALPRPDPLAGKRRDTVGERTDRPGSLPCTDSPAAQLKQPAAQLKQTAAQLKQTAAQLKQTAATGAVRLVTSAEEVSAALLEVVDGAQESLVAVGSRSRRPGYLRRIEQAVRARPQLLHYRILIGLPHSHLLKSHLLELLDARPQGPAPGGDRRLRLCLLEDLTAAYERFFTASERAAVVVLPSANSPANYDTALVVDDPGYARRLVEHAQALYGQRILDTAASIRDLPVLR
jgi:transcriptional regulator with XRE-family HTH domain